MAIYRSLWSQLDRDRWTCLPDRGVETSETIRYPDLVVEPADEPDTSLATRRPALVVEVLSPSSRRTDLAEKPDEYLSLETLHAYIVAEQDAPTWRVWQRGKDDTFPAEPTLFGAADTVTIAALSMTLGIAAFMADAR
jgi:Uma2 family endonuclease